MASLGGQKNFTQFMEDVHQREEKGETMIDSPENFRKMIGKVILFKQVNLLVRSMFPAYQGNVAIYLVSMIAKAHGEQIGLLKIWENQGISAAFKDQIRVWAKEVNIALHATSEGRMISEWAKKPECWEQIQRVVLSPLTAVIPEILAGKRNGT